jgi:uncharacterized protein
MDTTEESIGAVSTLYEAFERGDRAAIGRTLADDVRWRQAAVAVPAAGEDRVGATAVLDDVFAAIDARFDHFVETVEQLFGCDDRVVVTGTYRATDRRTGRALSAEFCHLWTVHDGVITAFRQYTDTAAFDEAARDGADP